MWSESVQTRTTDDCLRQFQNWEIAAEENKVSMFIVIRSLEALSADEGINRSRSNVVLVGERMNQSARVPVSAHKILSPMEFSPLVKSSTLFKPYKNGVTQPARIYCNGLYIQYGLSGRARLTFLTYELYGT
jgi:hypothetical protein